MDNKKSPIIWFPYTHSLHKSSLNIRHKLIHPRTISYSVIFSIILFLIVLHPNFINTIILTLLFTALPEEWFFRGYLLKNINELLCRFTPTTHSLHKTAFYNNFSLSSNIITSILFSLLHVPTQGIFGLSTFLPSLMFGLVYQKTHDLALVIILHTLSNTLFYIYIVDLI